MMEDLAVIVKAQYLRQVCMVVAAISVHPLFKQLESVAAVSTGRGLARSRAYSPAHAMIKKVFLNLMEGRLLEYFS